MRIATLFLLGASVCPGQDIPEVSGKTLPPVPGPMAERLPDPARGMGHPTLEDQIRRQARRSGFIPARAVPAAPVAILDRIADPAGWRAYRVEVQAKGSVHARLTGDHGAWFLVSVVNRWGQLEQGMLQNRIPTGNPEASYINPKAQAMTVYFVVDTTEAGARDEPFRLTFRPR